MGIFNKLVQQKRRNMLILSLLLLISGVFINKTNSISLTHISKQTQGNDYGMESSCIAEDNERYKGIGWIYPFPQLPEQIPNITTKYVPQLTSNYNCKFTKNDLCTKSWNIKNWAITDTVPLNLTDIIVDGRWDELPTIFISNITKEFHERVELSNEDFQLGFSVRSQSFVELLICSGWDPYNYPCYYMKIDNFTIFLQKYNALPKNISDLEMLDHYRAFTKILPTDEWRSFTISVNKGIVSLVDANFDRKVIEYNDKELLVKPLYFFMRSDLPSLWKIHKNHFLHTTSPQTSRLGQSYTITSKDLCISLYVYMCNDCQMKFFYVNNTEKILLKEIESFNNNWYNIKIKKENIQADKINIFVETKFKIQTNRTDGFWAIDNVRTCNENEVRITYLKLKSKNNNNISCQLINKPNWRPKLLEFSKIETFPDVDVQFNITSLKLNWRQEDEQNRINYFISYKANDICTQDPHNIRRLKSTGFIVTKHNEVLLDQLVPYTRYDINISSVLHENDKFLSVNTLETDLPTIEEMPNKVKIRTTDHSVSISWDTIDCIQIYGRLFYDLIVKNDQLNFEKSIKMVTDISYEIDGLKPFTNYNLNIFVYRSKENRNKSEAISFNFTTSSAVARRIENAELYSIDENSASIRFNIPENNTGIPELIQVQRCNLLSFKKCKSYISELMKCKLWPQKYCIDVNYLIPHQQFTFKISIKNRDTNAFGKETVLDGYTIERVPGAPLNISYDITGCNQTDDFCHLNITWLHPYYQNGSITSFTIYLNGSNGQQIEPIPEIYHIHNGTYMKKYTHQIKYIPYSTRFNIYIRSDNKKYHSDYVWKMIETSNLGDYINQMPQLIKETHNTATFQLANLDKRLTLYKTLVIVQDYNKDKKLNNKFLMPYKDELCNENDGWLAENVTVNSHENNETLIINDLQPNKKYCLTFIIENLHHNKTHQVVYYDVVKTMSENKEEKVAASTSNQYSHLWGLLVLLLLLPIGYFIYRYIKKRKHRKSVQNDNIENEYESLPFEECDNFVNNATYDQLVHK